MYVVCVTVYVKEGREDQFIEATLENARNSRKEEGNLRFDVLRSNDEGGRFFLYEVYRSEGDFKTHQNQDHYHRWKETVADWMARPREGVKHTSLFPEDGAF